MTDNNSMAYYKTGHVGRIGMFEPQPVIFSSPKNGEPGSLSGGPCFPTGGPGLPNWNNYLS